MNRRFWLVEEQEPARAVVDAVSTCSFDVGWLVQFVDELIALDPELLTRERMTPAPCCCRRS